MEKTTYNMTPFWAMVMSCIYVLHMYIGIWLYEQGKQYGRVLWGYVTLFISYFWLSVFQAHGTIAISGPLVVGWGLVSCGQKWRVSSGQKYVIASSRTLRTHFPLPHYCHCSWQQLFHESQSQSEETWSRAPNKPWWTHGMGKINSCNEPLSFAGCFYPV